MAIHHVIVGSDLTPMMLRCYHTPCLLKLYNLDLIPCPLLSHIALSWMRAVHMHCSYAYFTIMFTIMISHLCSFILYVYCHSFSPMFVSLLCLVWLFLSYAYSSFIPAVVIPCFPYGSFSFISIVKISHFFYMLIPFAWLLSLLPTYACSIYMFTVIYNSQMPTSLLCPISTCMTGLYYCSMLLFLSLWDSTSGLN